MKLDNIHGVKIDGADVTVTGKRGKVDFVIIITNDNFFFYLTTLNYVLATITPIK